MITGFSNRSNPYVQHGITPTSLRALENLGLIFEFDGANGPSLDRLIGRDILAHSDGFVVFTREPQSANVNAGAVSFTQTGSELSNLCLPLENPQGFVDWLRPHLASQ